MHMRLAAHLSGVLPACRWGLADTQPFVEASFEGHTDWVNDIALVDDQVLATCSNDATVRLWRAGSAGQCTFNLVQHTDCVMALAAVPQQGLLASAGLSSEVFVWDLPTGTHLSTVREAACSCASPAASAARTLC